MTTTNVPGVKFTPTGIVLPAESEILAGVQADQDQAFGGGVNRALETPQGQLASSTTAIIGDKNNQVALLPNQMNPDVNDGIWQDAIARIYFIDRKPAIPTAVQCDCMGAVGTVIPVGAQAKDTAGNIYVATASGAIPDSGTVSLPFACTTSGPIVCPAGTLTIIYQAIPGWDRVNNPGDGVPGANVESRADFAYRRQQSVALNGRGSLPSIYAAVFNVPDVIDVYAYENVTSAPIKVGATNYELVPHSLYVAAVGGASEDIAKAIWLKKDVGCDYNGNTAVTVTDPSGYSPPYPSYEVKFEIPPSLPIKFAVQLINSPLLPSNIVQLVQNAIVSAFNGADGGSRARIGSLLLASRYYGPVSLIDPSVSVLSVLLGSSSPTLTSQQIGIDQFPTVTANNISVTLV
ncbi:baseplate J/gp47 family protein [Pandoraea apista]|uniref:baseplate J/gp47 family protein n=1 Tax=Pandoraea apista TaxID=93218 RepID=UPI002F955E81